MNRVPPKEEERRMQMSETKRGGSAFDRIMADPQLAAARKKLSAHEIMTIIRHVWATEEASTDVMDITINGVRFTWTEPTISHAQICELADQPIHASGTYSYRVHGGRLSGVTYKGKSVAVYPDMEISAVVTGSA